MLDVPYYYLRDYEPKGIDVVVSGRGYTSEIGFEIYCSDASRNAEKLWEIVLEVGKPNGLAVIGPCHIRRIEGGILACGADMAGPKIQPPVPATSSVVRSVAPERCHVAFWIEAL